MEFYNWSKGPSVNDNHNSPMWYSGPECGDDEELNHMSTRSDTADTDFASAGLSRVPNPGTRFGPEEWSITPERELFPFTFMLPPVDAEDLGPPFTPTQDWNNPPVEVDGEATGQLEPEVTETSNPEPQGDDEAASGPSSPLADGSKENRPATTPARSTCARTRVQPKRARKAPPVGPVLIAASSSSAAPSRPRARQSRKTPRGTADAVAGPSNNRKAGPSTASAFPSAPEASGSGQVAQDGRKRGRDESDDGNDDAQSSTARGRKRRRNPGEINQYLASDPQDTECEVPGCEETINGRDRKALIKHLKTHYAAGAMSDSSRHYACAWGDCTKEITGTIMVDHVRSVHLGMQWVCPVGCGWDTGDYTHVNTHMKRSHPTVVWPPPKLDAP